MTDGKGHVYLLPIADYGNEGEKDYLRKTAILDKSERDWKRLREFQEASVQNPLFRELLGQRTTSKSTGNDIYEESLKLQIANAPDEQVKALLLDLQKQFRDYRNRTEEPKSELDVENKTKREEIQKKEGQSLSQRRAERGEPSTERKKEAENFRITMLGDKDKQTKEKVKQ